MANTTDTNPTAEVKNRDVRAGSDDIAQLNDGDQGWLPLSQLVPHPDNPRMTLGDLDEMVRSIKAHGVLEPLLILPCHDERRRLHYVVAGHRRYAAAGKAGAEKAPVVVRAMTDVEVIEAMLSENLNRAALTLGEEIRAIERLMSLDGALTPARLCKRIGKSQAWVRSRMSVTILPSTWRKAIDDGQLTLAAAEAAAGAADLGPAQLDELCAEMLKGRSYDPARTVQEFRNRLQRDARYDDALKKVRRERAPVYTDQESVPKRSKLVAELFSGETRGRHNGESCHAVLVKRNHWGSGVTVEGLCVDPRRHKAKVVESGKGSKLLADRVRPVDTENQHLKRKGRLSRIEHAIALFAKRKGGPSQAQLTRLALSALVLEAGREPLKFAATILAIENPKEVQAEELLAAADSPAKLARLAGAVACGLAEDDMYWYTSGGQCQAWIALLCESGWTPDDWTAATLSRRSKAADRRDGPPSGGIPDEDDVGDEAVLADVARDEVGDELGDEGTDQSVGADTDSEPAAVGGDLQDDEVDDDLRSDITAA
jgi:ParB family chromosome partitioning protein